ncbi:hypothetical protein ES703_02326 [subsurface metagenome]
MKTKRFIIFRNVFFILMALVLVGGLTAGWRAATRPSTAELRVTNLVISPAEVYVGEQTAIFAEVTNNGDSDDTHTIVLTVNNSNGQEVEKGETEVPVPAGKMTTVEFAITLNIPDTYKIEVDGWTGTLEVMERPTGAEFRVIGLAITPPTVEVGEMVIVSGDRGEAGGSSGSGGDGNSGIYPRYQCSGHLRNRGRWTEGLPGGDRSLILNVRKSKSQKGGE